MIYGARRHKKIITSLFFVFLISSAAKGGKPPKTRRQDGRRSGVREGRGREQRNETAFRQAGGVPADGGRQAEAFRQEAFRQTGGAASGGVPTGGVPADGGRQAGIVPASLLRPTVRRPRKAGKIPQDRRKISSRTIGDDAPFDAGSFRRPFPPGKGGNGERAGAADAGNGVVRRKIRKQKNLENRNSYC